MRSPGSRRYSSSQTSCDDTIDTPTRVHRHSFDNDSASDYSSYSEWREKVLEKEIQTPSKLARPRRRRPLLLLVIVAIVTVIFASYTFSLVAKAYSRTSSTLKNIVGHESYFRNLYEKDKAGPGTFPLAIQNALPSDLCSICDCHATPAFYSPARSYLAELPPRPHVKHVYPTPESIDTNEFMRQTLLDIYCARQHLDPYQAAKLLRRSGSSLGELMSWSLASLEFGKPTIYLTTATSPNGKAGPLRPQYFRRNGRAIRSWIAQQTTMAQAQHPGWQVVWIVAEDEVDIDPLVIRTLRRTGIPYVYFAYGLTKSWGNAQKNAVLQVVYALSRPEASGGLFGHGPVYGLDDDNKVLPDLLGLLTQVDRIGIVPVGNLGMDSYEEPVVDNLGNIVESESLWGPEWGRKYAFDYGGFSFNSSLLGSVISGPMFWKHQDFAGESEFMDQIIGNIRDLEPLCGRQQEQTCHYVWHNEPLLELEMMTDDEEISYVKKFGAEGLFQALGFQSRNMEAAKADQYQPPIPE